MKKKVIWGSIIVFIIDLVSKLILNKYLVLGKSYTILSRFIYITKVYNSGISFSMLTGKRWLIILLTIIIFAFLVLYLRKFKENKRNLIGFSLLFGGLFGNLLDRIIYGYVIDFIDIYIFGYNYPVFNLADSAICIGVILILYAIYLGEDNETSSRK